MRPGGRLPTTFPVRVEDAPAHDSYPGKEGRVDYTDGLLMGYRGYDRAGTEPRFCFGHGLTYTTFDYSDLEVDGRRVSVAVSNTGARDGHEVVQLYVQRIDAPTLRPERELRRFAKVAIAAGATRDRHLRARRPCLLRVARRRVGRPRRVVGGARRALVA